MKQVAAFLAIALFSCARAACTDGDVQPSTVNCQQYQVCKNGTWSDANCLPLIQKFSKDDKKCVWWFQSDCDIKPECSKNGAFLKSPYSCNSYYECEDGQLKAKSCWPLFTFDGTSCKFWGSCDTTVSAEDGSYARESEQYADPCSAGDSEPIANHCYWYKTCGADGFFKETSCPVGKYFNVDTKSCDWFWKVNCQVSICDGKARAPADSNGRVYYQCVQGYLMKKTCGWLQKFDAEKGECIFSLNQLKLKTVQNENKQLTGDSVQELAVAKQVGNTRSKRSAESCSNGSYKSHPNCRMFYVCSQNQWIARNCSLGMIFSDAGCKFSWEAQCVAGSCLANTKSADPQDCTKYINCDDKNVQTTVDCPTSWLWKWKRFDPASAECVSVMPWYTCPKPSTYLESCPEGLTRGTSVPNVYQLCRQDRWEKVTCSDGDVYMQNLFGCGCINEAAHKAAVPPGEYLECQNGRWVQLKCLLGGIFNPRTKMCVKPN